MRTVPTIRWGEFTSDLCLVVDGDGIRHVGEYHTNGYWYVFDKKIGHTTLLNKPVTEWEYMNPVEKTDGEDHDES